MGNAEDLFNQVSGSVFFLQNYYLIDPHVAAFSLVITCRRFPLTILKTVSHSILKWNAGQGGLKDCWPDNSSVALGDPAVGLVPVGMRRLPFPNLGHSFNGTAVVCLPHLPQPWPAERPLPCLPVSRGLFTLHRSSVGNLWEGVVRTLPKKEG